MCTYFGTVNLSNKLCLDFFCEGILFDPQPRWRLSDRCEVGTPVSLGCDGV